MAPPAPQSTWLKDLSLSLSLSLSLAADNGINKDGWKRGSVGGVGGAGGAGGGGTRAAVDHPLCLFLAF